MELHVRVTADPDEPLAIDLERAEAGYAWLMAYWADGTIVDEPYAFEQTGGYMNVQMPGDDWDTAILQLRRWLQDYPLIETITYQVDKRVKLDEGFEKLYAAIREQRKIEVDR